MTELSVVVPVYNEAENIMPLVADIHAALNGKVDFEIVYVDDGSSDNTPQQLDLAKIQHGRMTIVRHVTNAGQSAAMMNGVKVASGEWVATLDGDGQNPPSEILKLLAKRDGFEGDKKKLMVAGVRAKRQDNIVRKLSSKIGNGVRNFMLRDGALDTGCSLKLFRRDIYIEMPYFDHMHRFLPALWLRQGGLLIQQDVDHKARHAGVSKYGFGVWNRLKVSIFDLLGVMWLQRRVRLTDIEVR